MILLTFFSFLTLLSLRNNNGPKKDPCGTPAFTVAQAET